MVIPELQDKEPPNASDLERRIISSMIQEPLKYAFKAQEAGLTPDHLYKPSHAKLTSIIYNAVNLGEDIDVFIITDILKSKDILENMGGISEVTDIATCEVLHTNFDTYLSIILEKATQRNMMKYFFEMFHESQKDHDDLNELITRCNKTGEDFRIGFSETHRPETSHEVIEALIEVMEETTQKGVAVNLPTPWEGLNKFMLGGYKKGDIHVTAACPSGGKTSKMLCLALHIARSGEPVCIFSNESSNIELMQRLVANLSNIPIGVIMNMKWYGRKINSEEMGRISEATREIKKLPIHWHFFKRATRLELDKITRLMESKGVKTFFIDYLQNFQAANNNEASSGFKKAIVDPVMENIKELNRTYGSTFFVYAQLKQDAIGKKLDQLNMSYIKDSGNVIQDADTVCFLLNGLENEGDDRNATHGTPKLRRQYFFKGRNVGSDEFIDYRLDGKYARFEYIEN